MAKAEYATLTQEWNTYESDDNGIANLVNPGCTGCGELGYQVWK
jgi:hypothetical protein